MPTTADLMSMWNASGLKEKLIFTFSNAYIISFWHSSTFVWCK